MNIKVLLAGAAFLAVSLTAAVSQAGVIYNIPATGEFDTASAPSPASFTYAPGGAATVTLFVDGYASLDGQNFYEDDFTFKLNNATVLTGTFNLGGGGASVVYTAPPGTVATNLTYGNSQDVTFAGGVEELVIPVTLAAGLNTLSFSYLSLPGPANAGFQGIGDEGWGIGAESVVAVPEPATWAMMLVGIGCLGAMLRGAARRKQALAA